MRRLLIRVTLAASVLAGLFSLLMSALIQAPWPLALVRAVLAFAIVVAVGAGAGVILMRTALRRYYEQRHARSTALRPGASR